MTKQNPQPQYHCRNRSGSCLGGQMTIAQRFKPGTAAIRLPSPRRDDRSRQLRRSGMFIAREPKQILAALDRNVGAPPASC